MRRLPFSALLLVCVSGPVMAQTAADSLGIRTAALDYIEGYYAGDGDRMARALHPELVKRIRSVDGRERVWIDEMGATKLVRITRTGAGAEVPAAEQKTDVRILDIHRNAASARIDAGAWVDYLHLVRWEGRWVILNVLWELSPPG